MIHIRREDNLVIVEVEDGDLAPKHESQLVVWGFSPRTSANTFECPIGDKTPRIVAYLRRSGRKCSLTAEIRDILVTHQTQSRRLAEAIAQGRQFKDGNGGGSQAVEFIRYTQSNIARQLKEHQLKAALHLVSVGNGANFSVPGSGKTSVALAVFAWLRSKGMIDSLFVVGPPACFGPWRTEYQAVVGTEPSCEVLAGGDIDVRRGKYYVNATSVSDLYLTTFQTLERDWEAVRVLFERQGVRFFLVIDEAHYIKQIDGAWATAVLGIAKYAERRCILTGSPFPCSYADGFNLFDVLWPESPPIANEDRHKITLYCQQRHWDRAAQLLDESIGPLFYRVRKSDLHLAPQIFHPPVVVGMKQYERLIYDSVLDRIRNISMPDYVRNLDLLLRLRRGRMVRFRQCLSYAGLLAGAVTEYNEDIVENDISLSDVISHYAQLESPAKLDTLMRLVQDLHSQGEKVLVWANFIGTLEHVQDTVASSGIGVRLIYGATPVDKFDAKDEMTREEIIAMFLDRNSGVDVLVANPAACAESISLHKTCSHAIYYDLSYNCAQYIQSLDRIHRVGGSEDKPSHYYFLQYGDTLEHDILDNVRRKAENMSRVIDREYPVYSLDMFGEDDEVEAYERLFGSERKQ